MDEQLCVYIHSRKLLEFADLNPAASKRASMVYCLIKSYGLLNSCKTVESGECDETELRLFHTSDYLKCLKKKYGVRNTEGDKISDDSEDESMFGLEYDCPKFDGVYEYVRRIAGSTVKAAEEIMNGAKCVINWSGGWHHAENNRARGFCYVNDIILGIIKLRREFDRILYVDLDVHHGDAVETAFCSSRNVFTLSFHCFERGFYPGTGSVDDIGFGPGQGYSINFPYKCGIQGNYFVKYFKRVFKLIFDRYKPKALLVQCGADVISGDRLGNANLIAEDLGQCIKEILEKNCPAIFMGGGGYDFANTSRYWAYLTALICNVRIPLSTDIPDHEYFLEYGPGYELEIRRKNIKDFNTTEYLDEIYDKICGKDADGHSELLCSCKKLEHCKQKMNCLPKEIVK